MDFRPNNQSASSRPAATTTVQVADDPTPKEEKTKLPKTRGKVADSKWLRVLNSIVLIGVAVLVGTIAIALTRANSGGEAGFVNKSKYQAVFMQGGAVYFGNIQSVTSKYIDLTNVFYLQTNSTASSTTATSANAGYSLLQLGCQEVHDPYNQMIINRDQVTFWENLKDDGTIVTKINEFKKNFPNGPDCSQVTTQTQASDSSTQNSTGGASSTTGTTPSTTK